MNFNPTRLSLARKRRMLSKKALAQSMEVEPKTVIRWEGGQATPTPENIVGLSYVLNYPQKFFYGEDIDEPSAESTSFRSQTSMLASERDAALAAGQLAFLLSDWIEERFDLPDVKLHDLSLYSPEDAARALREEWALGEKPIFNMIQLLESKGVTVFALAENTLHINAYSLWRNEKPYVFLNTVKSAESSRFDAAHELGHLVLHQDGKAKGRDAEDQANRFASSFLMPKADVISVLPRVNSLHQIIGNKKRWGVSVSALNYRLHKLGITTDWKNRDFCIEIATKGYNKNEPQGMVREKSLVWDKVLKALWSEKTTEFEIAQALDIPVEEVRDLLFCPQVSPPHRGDGSSTDLQVISESQVG